VDRLLGFGFEVVAVSKSGGFTSKGQVIHSVDFFSEMVPTSLLSNVDVVYHLAGIAHERASNEEYEKINIAATLKLAEKASICSVSRFVFLSSVNANSGSNDFIRSMEPYADSKKIAENELEKRFFDNDMSVDIVRSSLVYGQGMKGNLLTLAKAIDKGLPRPPEIGARNMISLEDLVSFLVLIVQESSDGVRKTVVTDGEVYSVSRVYDAIRAMFGREKANSWLPLGAWRIMSLFYDLVLRLPVGVTFQKLFSDQLFDSSELKNWKVTISFEDALEKSFNSYFWNT